MPTTYENITHLLTSALLIDVDLSRWDEVIRFVVSVDQNEEFGPTSDLYNLDCIEVTSFSWNASSAMTVTRQPGIHTRVQFWRVQILERDKDIRVEIKTSGPLIALECGRLDLLVSDTKLASITDPEWFKPGHRFVRGSLEEIAGRLSGSRSRQKGP